MDSAFLLNEQGCADFLRFVMQSFGCTYICLWSYLPRPSNCLWFKDGIYHEENTQLPITSTTIHQARRRLFDEYKNAVFIVESDSIPGIAFKNHLSYFELKEIDLRRLASNELQRQFYQEARIKTAIFMGCKSGEIELGFPYEQLQIDMEVQMKNWFLENFQQLHDFPQDQNRVLSSSSSSLRSISMESPENPSLMFSTSTPSSYNMNKIPFKDTPFILDQALRPSSTNPQQQTQPISFPTLESDDAAMTQAILAVISSTSASISTSNSSMYNYHDNRKVSAFTSYNPGLVPLPFTQMKPNNLRRNSMMNRVVSYYRNLNLRRARENSLQGNRPTSNQLLHMISERKRRERLNESFQALRSLLPHVSKKDKASVLANTRDYLTSLKAQVSELNRRNQLLEAKLLLHEEDKEEESDMHEGINVRIMPVSESTSSSGEKMVKVRLSTRGVCVNKMDMMIRILEFLKRIEHVSFISMETETRMTSSSVASTSRNVVDVVALRLKIEGNEWDEFAFEEAMKRVVADLVQ